MRSFHSGTDFDLRLRSTAFRATQRRFDLLGDQLVDEPHAARGRGADHRARQHRCMADERAGLPDRARRAVEAREDAELHLGEAEPGGVIARGDAVMAGERQLEPAAQAEAVDAAHHRHRHALDAVEIGIDARDVVDDLALARELIELAHVGADDEALLLAGDEDEAADAPCRAPPARLRSTIIASSSRDRRPSEFWLSPSRSNTAQAMPCGSIENRQSRKSVHVGVMASTPASLRRSGRSALPSRCAPPSCSAASPPPDRNGRPRSRVRSAARPRAAAAPRSR